MTRVTRALVVALASGCGGRAPVPAVGDTAVATAPAPADTLVLTTSTGATVWLAEGRSARDSAGTACQERSVEIRTDSTTIKVPLLFVTSAPTEIRPGQLRAELSRNCRVMAVYRVEIATGRPVKLEDR